MPNNHHIDLIAGDDDGPDGPHGGGWNDPSAGATLRNERPWLGIHFECCNVYCRVYRNHPATAYVGFCPQCGRQVRLRVGPSGTDARFFSAS